MVLRAGSSEVAGWVPADSWAEGTERKACGDPYGTPWGQGEARPCGVWCLLLCMNLSRSLPVGCTLTTPGDHLANSPAWILNPSQDQSMTPPGKSLPAPSQVLGPHWAEPCRDLPPAPGDPVSIVTPRPTPWTAKPGGAAWGAAGPVLRAGGLPCVHPNASQQKSRAKQNKTKHFAF